MEFLSAETNSTHLLWEPTDEPPVILSMVVMGLTFLLGLPANGLVLWVAGLKMQRTVTTTWFLHLTLADFFCCLSLPFNIVHLTFQGQWPYGRLLCKLLPSVIILNLFASVFLITVISLNRCLVVLKPIWCQNYRNVRTASIICGCIWVMAFAMCLPVLLYWEVFTIGNKNLCSYNFGDFDLDYFDPYFNILENRLPDDVSITQLPRELDDRLDFSSSQTNDHLWTASTKNSPAIPTGLHMQTWLRPSGDSVELSRLSGQYSHEDQRTDTLKISDALFSLDLELFPSPSSNSEYTYELADNYQASPPLLAITFTRLLLGFLLPFIIMACCYILIIRRTQQGRFSKSRGKTSRVTMVVVAVFFVCWIPYHVFGVLRMFIDLGSPFGKALLSWDHMSTALASANSCFNPFLYALMGKSFRKKARSSIQSILEAAFNEELTYSTSCTQIKSLQKETPPVQLHENIE